MSMESAVRWPIYRAVRVAHGLVDFAATPLVRVARCVFLRYPGTPVSVGVVIWGLA